MDAYRKFYAVIRRVPRGKVATYGQIARLAGFPGAARQVGLALFVLQDTDTQLPWHRIINARGRISLPEPGASEQRRLLEAEGVVFRPSGIISLGLYGWDV